MAADIVDRLQAVERRCRELVAMWGARGELGRHYAETLTRRADLLSDAATEITRLRGIVQERGLVSTPVEDEGNGQAT